MAVCLVPQLFSNGEFELPVMPDGDSFRINGAVVASQLGFRKASEMVRTLADDEKVLVEAGANLRPGADEVPVGLISQPHECGHGLTCGFSGTALDYAHDLVLDMLPKLQQIGDPQANQYQLNIFPALFAIGGGA